MKPLALAVLLAVPASAASRAAMGPRLGAVHDLIRSVPNATHQGALVGLLTGSHDLKSAQAVLDGKATGAALTEAQMERFLASEMGRAFDLTDAPSAQLAQRYQDFIGLVETNSRRLGVAASRIAAARAPAFEGKGPLEDAGAGAPSTPFAAAMAAVETLTRSPGQNRVVLNLLYAGAQAPEAVQGSDPSKAAARALLEPEGRPSKQMQEAMKAALVPVLAGTDEVSQRLIQVQAEAPRAFDELIAQAYSWNAGTMRTSRPALTSTPLLEGLLNEHGTIHHHAARMLRANLQVMAKPKAVPTAAALKAGPAVVDAPARVGLKAGTVEAAQAAAVLAVMGQLDRLGLSLPALYAFAAGNAGTASQAWRGQVAAALSRTERGSSLLRKDGSLQPWAALVVRAAVSPAVDPQGMRNFPARLALRKLGNEDFQALLAGHLGGAKLSEDLKTRAAALLADGRLTQEAREALSGSFFGVTAPYSEETEAALRALNDRVRADESGRLEASPNLKVLLAAIRGIPEPLNVPAQAEKTRQSAERVSRQLAGASEVWRSAGRQPGDLLPHERARVDRILERVALRDDAGAPADFPPTSSGITLANLGLALAAVAVTLLALWAFGVPSMTP